MVEDSPKRQCLGHQQSLYQVRVALFRNCEKVCLVKFTSLQLVAVIQILLFPFELFKFVKTSRRHISESNGKVVLHPCIKVYILYCTPFFFQNAIPFWTPRPHPLWIPPVLMGRRDSPICFSQTTWLSRRGGEKSQDPLKGMWCAHFFHLRSKFQQKVNEDLKIWVKIDMSQWLLLSTTDLHICQNKTMGEASILLKKKTRKGFGLTCSCYLCILEGWNLAVWGGRIHTVLSSRQFFERWMLGIIFIAWPTKRDQKNQHKTATKTHRQLRIIFWIWSHVFNKCVFALGAWFWCFGSFLTFLPTSSRFPKGCRGFQLFPSTHPAPWRGVPNNKGVVAAAATLEVGYIQGTTANGTEFAIHKGTRVRRCDQNARNCTSSLTEVAWLEVREFFWGGFLGVLEGGGSFFR